MGVLSSKGFSLIEILISISIIALLSALGLGFAGIIQKNSRDATRESDLRVLQSALQQYYADQNKFPNTLSSELQNGSALTNCSGRVNCSVTRTYLSRVPKDPSGTAYYFRPVFNISSPNSECTIDAGVENGTCHYYFLCAKTENQVSGGTCYDTNFNFQVTPL